MLAAAFPATSSWPSRSAVAPRRGVSDVLTKASLGRDLAAAPVWLQQGLRRVCRFLTSGSPSQEEDQTRVEGSSPWGPVRAMAQSAPPESASLRTLVGQLSSPLTNEGVKTVQSSLDQLCDLVRSDASLRSAYRAAGGIAILATLLSCGERHAHSARTVSVRFSDGRLRTGSLQWDRNNFGILAERTTCPLN